MNGTKLSLLLLFGLATAGLSVGCTNPEGRFRPPDPIGYAIFEFFDRGPHGPPQNRSSDSDYVDGGLNTASPQRGLPPSRDSIWVEGTWGVSNGRRVWIPAHWQ